MPIKPIDEQELKELFLENQKEFGGRKEDYYAVMYLQQEFQLTPRACLQRYVAFGNHDFGLDAYYLNQAAGNLYLYQFKWSENHSLFKESMERLLAEGIERVFGDPFANPQENVLLNNLRYDLSEHRDAIKKVFLRFVFKGSRAKAEASATLTLLKEQIEDRRPVVVDGLGHDVPFHVDFIDDAKFVAPPPPLAQYEFTFSEAAVVTQKGASLHIGLIRLYDLCSALEAIGPRFLDRNIRAGLGEETDPNKKIGESLKKICVEGSMPVETFTFNHNGIALAAAAVEKKDGMVLLKVPRLINGAQTVTTVKSFLAEKSKVAGFASIEERLKGIKVVARIVEADPYSDFVTNVTIANNQQNPVDPWQLRANDRIQCEFQDFLGDYVYYERQEGAFEGLTFGDLVELGIGETSRRIQMWPLAQTLLASQGELERMAQRRQVFARQDWYESTFARKYFLGGDARRTILAYKCGITLNSAMRALGGLAIGKHREAMQRSKNLTWALLIQAFLNESNEKLSDVLDLHGVDLKKSKEFREEVERRTGKYIHPVLKALLNHGAYSGKVAAEDFAFLRGKKAYKDAMLISQEKFGWQKKSL